MLKVPHIPVLAVGWVFLAFTISTQASNPADIFADCKVDWLDLKMLGDDWLWTGPSAADIDNSGDVNFPDFAILANNWGWTCPPPEMVLILGGSFQMGDSKGEGSSAEIPVHTVTLDSFYMGKYEVTNAQYCQYLNSALDLGLVTVTNGVVYGSGNNQPYCDTHIYNDSQIDYSGGVFSVRTKGSRSMSNDPTIMVTWYGSVAYCNWRSQQEGKEVCYDLNDPNWQCDFTKHGYRLPTEAQWEYVARGGLSGKRFPWGDTISHTQANYYSDSIYSYDISPTRGYHPIWNDGTYPYTSPVGSFSGNGYGLCDMAGNAWEWCYDRYSSTYYSTTPYPHVNPTGPTSGSWRVIRGGGWNTYANGCRVASRGGTGVYPYNWYNCLGFRLSLDF